MNPLRFINPDRFVLALLATVLLAYLFPEAGTDASPLPLATLGSIGVSLIFFFYGLKLSPEKIRMGLRNWRLHLLVQSTTFLLFPLLVLPFYPLMQTEQQQLIWLSVFFLAALPSTVSSSVVMVSIARGNIPAAIFNASISGIIGIGLTPLWMGLFLQSQQGVGVQQEFDFTQIYGKLLLEIILPVVLGLLLQRWGHQFATRHSRALSRFDKGVILLIVYKSFAGSFAGGAFSAISVLDLLLILLLVLALFGSVYGLVYWLSSLLGFSAEDKITALFCGSKKSLVHGTVFSKVLFGQTAAVGLLLLPLMLFHALQILIISLIAGRYSRDGRP